MVAVFECIQRHTSFNNNRATHPQEVKESITQLTKIVAPTKITHIVAEQGCRIKEKKLVQLVHSTDSAMTVPIPCVSSCCELRVRTTV